MLSATEIADFRSSLRDWFRVHKRDLPWRRTRDPYAILISEIMLQQTRVAAAIPYYERFLARFPTVAALACAAEGDLLAAWAGLGYYHRVRNLQKAARIINTAGAFPSTYTDIRDLPGVGDYTAAAIASMCFDLPHAVLDGNVLRVLSRLLDDAANISSGSGRRHFAAGAGELLDRTDPGSFNQAMMELGATVCLPSRPQCLVCPVSALCRARQNGTQQDRPSRIERPTASDESRVVFWIAQADRILLWQRPPNLRLMPGFWELPELSHLPGVIAGPEIGAFTHTITHHRYRFTVVRATAPVEIGHCRWFELSELDSLPVSTVFKKARRTVAAAPPAFTTSASV